jgi:peptide/nickel transport system permease protein
MTTYVARRVLQMIPTVLLVMAIVFVVFRLMPGDPVQLILGADPDPEAVAALERRFGLDRPLVEQFGRWVFDAVRGDLGTSFAREEPVLGIILERFPATAQITVFAMILATLVGVPLGIVSALRQDSWLDLTVRTFSLLGFSMPRYWLAILLVIVFSLNLGWIPPAGYVAFTEDPLRNLHYAILPTVSLSLHIAAEQMRFIRSSMLDVIRQDYVRTARSKGVPERSVIVKHSLKNAFIPFLTIFGLQLGLVLGGSVIVEYIAAWPGIGWLTLQAINQRDYAVVQGVVLFSAVAFLLINLVVDLLYTVLDPRIQYA